MAISIHGDGDSTVEVALSLKRPSSTVTVKLGRQAAVISGKVFDVESGTPAKAYVGLMDEEGNGRSVGVPTLY